MDGCVCVSLSDSLCVCVCVSLIASLRIAFPCWLGTVPGPPHVFSARQAAAHMGTDALAFGVVF